ncbi:hypothetical protein FB451DRAFT_1172296 [Mycena latifolia]|nr:hypothetical protein FB451DRAFT_1172296 [Mycena latifolia]
MCPYRWYRSKDLQRKPGKKTGKSRLRAACRGLEAPCTSVPPKRLLDRQCLAHVGVGHAEMRQRGEARPLGKHRGSKSFPATNKSPMRSFPVDLEIGPATM